MPICKSCGKKYIYLSLGNSKYCENCEPREVIYIDEEFNNTVKGIKRKRQKSINTNPNKSKNSENKEERSFYIILPLQIFLLPFIIIGLIIFSHVEKYNAKLKEESKNQRVYDMNSFPPEVQKILEKQFKLNEEKNLGSKE